MDIGELLNIAIAVILVNNFVFAQFLGICPYIGVTKDTQSAVGMGMAVVFVMTMTSLVTWMVYNWVLVPLGITYLYIIAFILIIASLVQFVEMLVQKTSPTLYQALGIYLPLITTNCAILGVAVLNKNALFETDFSLIKCIVQGFSAGIGFTVAMVLMSGIRERLDLAVVPKPLQGVPIAFVTAGLLAIAFMGFSGLSF